MFQISDGLVHLYAVRYQLLHSSVHHLLQLLPHCSSHYQPRKGTAGPGSQDERGFTAIQRQRQRNERRDPHRQNCVDERQFVGLHVDSIRSNRPHGGRWRPEQTYSTRLSTSRSDLQMRIGC